MDRGTCKKRGGMLAAAVLMLVAGLIMVMVSGCGGSDSDVADTTTTAASSTASSAAETEGNGEGALLGTEILDTFDELVGKVSETVKSKPEPAVVKPQLEELYASYEPTMKELNTKYLALKDSDAGEFGACNRFLSDNRPQRVGAITDIMVEPIKYYNFDLGAQDIVDLITKKPVELLDMAVAVTP
ncbi:MAG: hypothetical protein JXA87_08955 [Thermoleophilia bacterium]|nr:hypothetical protein [Thermoleophilia bacterium]